MCDFFEAGGLWLLICWLCAGVFSGIGLWANRRAEPMHFWSGTTVDPKKISDIPAYNRANARLWMLYGLPYWVVGVTYFWWPGWSVAGLAVWSVGGLGWLIWRYGKIKKQYFLD